MIGLPNGQQPDVYQPPTEKLLSGAQTADYITTPFAPNLQLYSNRPWFTLWQAEAMLWDQQVWFGVCLGTAPLISAKCEWKHPDASIQKFVQQQWDRLWDLYATKIAATRYFGYAGFEVTYRLAKGKVEIATLRDFHPRDVRPLVWKKGPARGKIAGVGLHGQRSGEMAEGGRYDSLDAKREPQQPTFLFGMRGLWLNYNARYSSNFGRSGLEPAYPAWWDKVMPGGAYDLRRLRGVKDAWIGDVIKYPSQKTFRLPSGEIVSAKAIARELAENRASGAVVTIPSDLDENGHPLWEYQPPTAIAGSDVVDKWLESSDWDIFDGVLVPREVVEAASSGSGYSGRSIPMIMFLGLRDWEFRAYVEAIREQTMVPLVCRNWGAKAAAELEADPVPLIEVMSDQVSGSDTGGPMGGSAGGQEMGGSGGRFGASAGGGAAGGPPGRPSGGPAQFGDGEVQTLDGKRGRWVTLEDSGTHIFIADGKVAAGPPALQGDPVGKMGSGKKPKGKPSSGPDMPVGEAAEPEAGDDSFDPSSFDGPAAEGDSAEDGDLSFDPDSFESGPDMPKSKAKPKKAGKPKKEKDPLGKPVNESSRLGAAIVDAARSATMSDGEELDPRLIREVLDEVHAPIQEEYYRRQRAKMRLKQDFGVNAGIIDRVEDDGFDHSSAWKHPVYGHKFQNYDAFLSSKASELPDLGLDPDDPDIGDKVWNLLKQKEIQKNGHQLYNIPKHDPRVIAAAVKVAKTYRDAIKKSLVNIDEDIPFSLPFTFQFSADEDPVMLFALSAPAKYKPAAGQQDMFGAFEEAEHPRAGDGKFKKKGTAGAPKKSKAAAAPVSKSAPAAAPSKPLSRSEVRARFERAKARDVVGLLNADEGEIDDTLDRYGPERVANAASVLLDMVEQFDSVMSKVSKDQEARRKQILNGAFAGESVDGYAQSDYLHLNYILRKYGDTERAAEKFFESEPYTDIGGAGVLVEEEFEGDTKAAAGDCHAQIQRIRQAIDECGELPEPVTVMRGMTMRKSTDREAFLAQFKPGRKLRLGGFVSTTLSPATAAQFGTDVLFRIKAKRGMLMPAILEHDDLGEAELLQSYETKYRVAGIKTGEVMLDVKRGIENATIIDLEEV